MERHVCVKCGEVIVGVHCTTGLPGQHMHQWCWEQDHPPIVAHSLFQVARGCGDGVLAAQVITEFVDEDLAAEIVDEFNRRMMMSWQKRCMPY